MKNERRKYPRHEVPYTLAECVLGHSDREVDFVGFICNHSECGVCINTSLELNTGQTITITSKDLELSKKAIVRWARNESTCSYKIGLEFVEC